MDLLTTIGDCISDVFFVHGMLTDSLLHRYESDSQENKSSASAEGDCFLPISLSPLRHNNLLLFYLLVLPSILDLCIIFWRFLSHASLGALLSMLGLCLLFFVFFFPTYIPA